MVRKVLLSDVRVARSGRIMTGPVWAYRRGKYGHAEPIPEAWQDLVRALEPRAEADYRRRVAWWSKAVRVQVRPPRADDVRTCWVCDQQFYGACQLRTCSPACHRARQAPRASRAKPRQETRCPTCGDVFEQTRQDARFCSVRCRVAAHRAQHAGRQDGEGLPYTGIR
jgi:hypothetical protein